MLNNIKSIVLHNGNGTQILKAKEELVELLQALSKNDAGDIAEEIADVEIMLEQLKYIYACAPLVELIKKLKVARTLKIMNGECKVLKENRPSYCGKEIHACEKCRGSELIMSKYKVNESQESYKAIYENKRFVTLMFKNLYPMSFFRYELTLVNNRGAKS